MFSMFKTIVDAILLFIIDSIEATGLLQQLKEFLCKLLQGLLK